MIKFNMLKKISSRRKWKIFVVSYVALEYEFVRKIILRLYRIIKGKDCHLKKIHRATNYQLKSDGYIELPSLINDQTVDEIRSSLDKLKVNCPECGQDEFVPLNSINRKQCYVARYREADLKRIPIINSIVNNEFILSLVQEYLGFKPTIMSVNTWWSFSGRDESVQSQKFHRDRDCLKWLKLFIYLTDVDGNSGPHVYIKNSIDSKKFRSRKDNRFSDDSIYTEFGKENEIIFTGKAGYAFIEDTFGLHKGTLPFNNDRLLLQVQYGSGEDIFGIDGKI